MGVSPGLASRFVENVRGNTSRNIEYVPPTELRAIVYATAKAVFGSPRRELVVETARKLGYSKTGRRITEVLDIVIQELLEEERLSESFGIVHAID